MLAWLPAVFVLMVCLCVTLRLLQGVGRPDEVLACVDAGVDLFESFFPFQVTERSCALSFNYDISPDPERAGRAPPAGVVNNTAEQKFCYNFSTSSCII